MLRDCQLVPFRFYDHDTKEKNSEDFSTLCKFVFLSDHIFREAVAQRCSVKKVFLEISQNSQENTCARFFSLIKLQAWVWYRYFKNTFFIKHLRTTTPDALKGFKKIFLIFNIYGCHSQTENTFSKK